MSLDNILLIPGVGGGATPPAFSPTDIASLLWWYDPSDLSTLFQDSAGTTPVTSDGDPVGLVLDKSEGLVAGSDVSLASTFLKTTDGTQFTTLLNAAGNEGKWFEVTLDASVASGIIVQSTALATSISVTITTGSNRVILPIVLSTGVIRIGGVTVSRADVTNIVVREIPGYHRFQPTSGSRLTYRTSGGLHWLEYGGVDDGMYTATTVDHSVSDEVTVCSGVEFGVDSTTEVFIENSSNSGSSSGKFAFFNASGGVRNWRSTGTNTVTISNTIAPSKIVQTGLAKISTDLCKLRQDGAEVATSSSDQGSGNYGNEVIYFGRRNNATLPFNGNEYQSCGFTSVLSGTDLSNIESFVANKTGVSL